ncbi:MAG: hypothetical protein ACI9JT_000680 [Polaribacter sp.]|jgi:hypothetical protein
MRVMFIYRDTKLAIYFYQGKEYEKTATNLVAVFLSESILKIYFIFKKEKLYFNPTFINGLLRLPPLEAT